MPDQPDQQAELNLQRLKELSQLIDNGEAVKETLESKGWKEILEPLLNKLIVDVVGGNENGRWHNGSLDDKRLGEKRLDILMAYKHALVDFSNYIYTYVDPLDKYREEYNEIVREEENPEFKDMETEYDGKED